MSGVLDSSDWNEARMRWLSTLSCTPDYCFWMDWGHQIKVAVNVTTVHPPIIPRHMNDWDGVQQKNWEQSKGCCSYCCYAVFFPSPEIGSNSHQVKCLPLPSAESQSLPKNGAWSSEFVSEDDLARHTQHRCCSPHCTTPSPAVRCQVWDPFTPQVCLEKAVICN